ncbi:MAG: hypothetical protein ACYCPM_13110, partial [Acidobacteriaceae bacterium]
RINLHAMLSTDQGEQSKRITSTKATLSTASPQEPRKHMQTPNEKIKPLRKNSMRVFPQPV